MPTISATGTILDDSDFYPFGGEHVVVSNSGNTYKFTGKERDAETNLDEFGARYYSSQFGRWITPDWSAAPSAVPYAELVNPQSLNLYAYVRNNPVTSADLDGHMIAADTTNKMAGDLGGEGHWGPTTGPDHSDDFAPEFGAANSERNTDTSNPPTANNSGDSADANPSADPQAQQAWSQNQTQQTQQQSNAPKNVQDAINRGEPPNGEYSFLFGKSCPDCKYYPKEVVEAVDAHENQHAQDEHTLSGFFKLFTKNGRRELETKAFKAELAVEERNIKKLETIGPRTLMQEKTLTILKNMRDQAKGAIEFPQVYTP